MQNVSHAVMAQRAEPLDSLDHFPTPKWATRALLEEIMTPTSSLRTMSCWEPACGEGFTASVLEEYFEEVRASDIHDFGYADVSDFLVGELLDRGERDAVDWVITNPPFRLAEEFALRALRTARVGVALLVRTGFLESVGRYNRLFQLHSPTYVAQFVERVPMVKGRMDQSAHTATGYCWVVWTESTATPPIFRWIPPCRKRLERSGDYERPSALRRASSRPKSPTA